MTRKHAMLNDVVYFFFLYFPTFSVLFCKKEFTSKDHRKVHFYRAIILILSPSELVQSKKVITKIIIVRSFFGN